MSDSAYGIKFIRFTVDMDDGSTYEMVLDTPEKVEAIAGIAWGPVNGKGASGMIFTIQRPQPARPLLGPASIP